MSRKSGGLFRFLLKNDDAEKDLHSAPAVALMCCFSGWSQLSTSTTERMSLISFLQNKVLTNVNELS